MASDSMLQKTRVIAIDGPAGSGKTTLANRLAQHLGYFYLDTGEMYRALTWAVVHRKVDVRDESAVTEVARQVKIDVTPPTISDGRVNDVLVDNQDVTWEIRRPEIEAKVSIVAAYPGVRQAMTILQRQIGQRGEVVMAGRDIGTVVFPDADIKIYLDASVEERARRRFEETSARGSTQTYESILASMRRRDEIDSTRQVAPLRPASDAIHIYSDGLSSDDVFTQVLSLLANR